MAIISSVSEIRSRNKNPEYSPSLIAAFIEWQDLDI